MGTTMVEYLHKLLGQIYATSQRASQQSPTLGAHAHGFDIIVYPCIQLQIRVNFSDAGNTLTKKRSRLKPTTVHDLLFVRSNQDLV